MHPEANLPVYYSADGKWVYQFSIIDYLQTFDFGKKQEVMAKRIFKNANPTNLSAVPSEPYGHRFQKFLKDFVLQKSQKLKKKEEEELIKQQMSAIMKLIQGSLVSALTSKLMGKN